MLPEAVHRRAQEARETNRRLMQQRRQLADHARSIVREAEAASAALRQTIWLPCEATNQKIRRPQPRTSSTSPDSKISAKTS